MPGQDKYREVSSCSIKDFLSRRMKTREENNDGQIFSHVELMALAWKNSNCCN